MNRAEDGILATNCSFAETYKSFHIHYALESKCLKRILTDLNCTKCNEINITHSNIQKNISKLLA